MFVTFESSNIIIVIYLSKFYIYIFKIEKPITLLLKEHDHSYQENEVPEKKITIPEYHKHKFYKSNKIYNK